MIAGMTVLPSRSSRAPPAGRAISPLRPMRVIAPRSTNSAALSMAGLPSPGMMRSPSSSMDCADAVCAANNARRLRMAQVHVLCSICESPPGLSLPPASPRAMLLLRRLEIPQVRRVLAFQHWHQPAVGADEIGFLADSGPGITLGADEFSPDRLRIGISAQIPDHRPWPGQRMIDDGDLIVQDVLVSLVEREAFLEHRFVVMVQRQPVSIVVARPLEAASLHFQHAVTAAVVFVEPPADRIAGERRLDLGRPIPSVGVDASGMLDPVDEHIGRL